MTDSLRDAILPPFPVDEDILVLVEHALRACYEVADDGTHTRIGADYDLPQLLNFLSGYDQSKSVLVLERERDRDCSNAAIYEYPGQIYSEHDVIRALVAEIRRLRMPPTCSPRWR